MENYTTYNIDNLSKADLRRYAVDYYAKNIQGKTVINKATGVTIFFDKVGKNKTARSLPTHAKVVIIINLLNLLENASCLNCKNPKQSHIDKYGAIGFINFMIKTNINGKVRKFKVGVMIVTGGKFQYNINEDFY